MGYDTHFEGQLTIDKPLTHWQIFYLNEFAETRHMIRNVTKIKYNNTDNRHWLLQLMNLPLNPGGEFYLPITKPTITCSLKNFKSFTPAFQKTILTLFCIHRFHYQHLDKNLFILIANRVIRDSFMDNSTNIMADYESFNCCIMALQHIEHSPDIINYNEPYSTQPGLWCQWIVLEQSLIWNGGEKFYKYREWLEYLIKEFFIPWGYTLNGRITFQGEDQDDCGYITVQNNILDIVRTKPADDDEYEYGYDGDGY